VRAAVLAEPGRPLTIEEVELDAPHVGELTVRVEAAGCCHSDYHYMTGDLTCPLPVVPGHEGAGVVEEVGPGVEQLSPGDAVCLMWRPRCGQCRYCLVGRPELCVAGRVEVATGGLLDGTSRLRLGGAPAYHLLGVSCFAERCVVPERSVVAIPEGVPFAVAAVAGCAVITGVGAVLHVIGSCAGESLLVVGAGGVGLSAVMGAAASGADPIVVVDRNPAALALAKTLGATHVIESPGGSSSGGPGSGGSGSDGPGAGGSAAGGPGAGGSGIEVLQAVRELCGEGVDWAIEAVGGAATLRLAFACLRPAGTVVALGLAAAGARCEVPINELVQREKRLVGSLYGSANPPVDLPRIFSMYQSGRLPLDRLLGRSWALEELNDAYAELAAGAVGRAIVVPGARSREGLT
jgi:S-(hydroxymethyl)glutathione dehydrogenase/alcohol dehydrogenase